MGSEKDGAVAKSEGVSFEHPAFAKPTILDHDQAIVRVEPRRTKVAIMGFASPHRDQAPFDDPSFEIWSLNQLYRHIPRCDRHFEIHRNWNEHVVEGTDHFGWLAACPAPIYMVDRIPGIPNSVRYPRERIKETLGLGYGTSTIAWMQQLALFEDFKEIHLYGVDLIVGTEYGIQKPCTEFWLGVAHGQGRSVIIPENCALLKSSHDYGFDLEPNWEPIKLSMLETRHEMLTKERQRAFQGLIHHDGMLAAVDEIRAGDLAKELGLSEEQTAKLKAYHDTTMKVRQEMLTQVVLHDGALGNNSFWLQVADLRLKGGSVFEAKP